MPEATVPENELEQRLPGTDGKAKMSKSLGNCIYLADDAETIKKKVMSMYTDPNHIKVDDPGQVEGNVVFTYLDVFAKDEDFVKYLPEYKNLDELKNHYRHGGLGDMVIKKFLNNILQEFLKPIRERREELAKNIEYVYRVLENGTKDARIHAKKTVDRVKQAMKIDYFESDEFLKEIIAKYQEK